MKTRTLVSTFALSIAGIALLAFRFLAIFTYRFDSDEPQHMHVAWGWAHGLVQYRDVFDNHMPLFHLLTAPLFAAGRDEVRLLFAARMLMVPLFVIAVYQTWLIARRLFDDTAALWGAIAAATFPLFFLGALEFRTDDLWVVFWLAAMAVAVGDRPLMHRGFLAGLFLGLAFAVSMKSILFIAALAIAVPLTCRLTRRPLVFTPALICVAMSIVPPALIAAAFAAAGLWRDFAYGVFRYNVIREEHAWRVLWFIVFYPIVRFIALRIARSGGDPALVRRRLFIFLMASSFGVILTAFWPVLAMESYLPLMPLYLLLIAGWLAPHRALVTAFAAAEIVLLIAMAQPWRNAAREEIDLVADVLTLTAPNEPVMDMKGESVFRHRPYYLVLESLANRRMHAGELRDRVAEVLVETATHVIASAHLLPHASRHFVARNYVRWGMVWVAGMPLPQLTRSEEATFDIDVPGAYVLASESGSVAAEIDGVDARNGVWLGRGRHRIRALGCVAHPLLLWAGALHTPNFMERQLAVFTRR